METTLATPTPTITMPVMPSVANRRAAMAALDPQVRQLLRRRVLSTAAASFLPPVLEMTAYDTVYAAIPAVGGHWTAATRRPWWMGLQVSDITVTLEFDRFDRPARFRVRGATEIVTDDADMDSLDRALAQATGAGRMRAWAPAFPPGISL